MYDMYDYHLHSTHSGDGKVPDIVQAMAAVERGVKEICFTDMQRLKKISINIA